MGAIIIIIYDTDDPTYEAQIHQAAKQIEAATGEPVEVEVGITDNRSAPNLIEIGRMADDERFKIRR